MLANSGQGTERRKKMITKGAVTIDGVSCTNPATQVDTDVNQVRLNGVLIGYKPYLYVMMNKPAGVLSATEDESMETVVDLLSDEDKRYAPHPVGRLDKDTVGLLFLTNDGTLTHFVTSPKRGVDKVYRVRIDRL